jgi:hypothetical protein
MLLVINTFLSLGAYAMVAPLNKEQRITKNYTKWKTVLDNIAFPYTFDDFLQLGPAKTSGKFTFKTVSCYSVDFYKERYWMLDYIAIHRLAKKRIVENRGSTYDVDNVMTKNNITREEAEALVEKRKSETNGSLDTYIKRHGEELGRIKFDEFRQKCIVTLESLIEKHGEELGTSKWENYCNTRDTGSIEYFLQKNNGDLVLATTEHNEFRQKCKDSSGKEYFDNKHGDGYYDDLCSRIGYASTLDYFIEEYGPDDGLLKYQELNAKKGITLDKMIEKYGEVDGTDRYLKWKDDIYKHSTNRNCVSKSSTEFFKSLESALNRKLQYGTKKDEIRLTDETLVKHFYYDCYDSVSNTIIEYNGANWHPSPLLMESERATWTVGGFDSTMSYYEALEFDNYKINFAKEQGYTVLVVWDYEINTKHKRKNKLQFLIGELNGQSSKDS